MQGEKGEAGPCGAQKVCPVAPFRKDAQHPVLLKHAERCVQRRAAEPAPISPDEAPGLRDHAGPDRRIGTLRSPDELDKPRAGIKEERGIGESEMVGGEDHRAGLRQVLQASDLKLSEMPDQAARKLAQAPSRRLTARVRDRVGSGHAKRYASPSGWQGLSQREGRLQAAGGPKK